jgi:hypothetical protein
MPHGRTRDRLDRKVGLGGDMDAVPHVIARAHFRREPGLGGDMA